MDPVPGVPLGSLRLANAAPQARKLRDFAATIRGENDSNVTVENSATVVEYITVRLVIYF